MKKENRSATRGVQVRYKIWPLNGFKVSHAKTKASQETMRNLRKFLDPEENPNVMFSDTSLECGKACEDLRWNRCTSTPHGSETDGIAERRVKEGTLTIHLKSGLDEHWWADSVECYCYLRNLQDLLPDGKTPYERRCGDHVSKPIIPFGANVEYHPIST